MSFPFTAYGKERIRCHFAVLWSVGGVVTKIFCQALWFLTIHHHCAVHDKVHKKRKDFLSGGFVFILWSSLKSYFSARVIKKGFVKYFRVALKQKRNIESGNLRTEKKNLKGKEFKKTTGS